MRLKHHYNGDDEFDASIHILLRVSCRFVHYYAMSATAGRVQQTILIIGIGIVTSKYCNVRFHNVV